MNFVENNGGKIAAVLCVASCIPVVATIYASGNQAGTDANKLIDGDSAIAKGWQEIEGKSWFFKENGSVDKEAGSAAVAKVSDTVSDNVNANIVATKQYVEEKTVEEEAVVVEEEIFVQLEEEPVQVAEVTEVQEETYVEEVYYEAPAAEEVVIEEVYEAPIEEVYEAPVEEEVVVFEEEEPVYEEELPIYEDEEEVYFEEDEVYYEEDVYYEDTYVEEVPSAPIYEDVTYEASSTGQAIADAAMGLIGWTDGWQCTEVATQALINAGVEGVPVCWPDQYQYYGTVSYDAEVGSLAYYYNGGRGYDHIAVYVGDGMCVHGNFDGTTILYSEICGTSSPDYYVIF